MPQRKISPAERPRGTRPFNEPEPAHVLAGRTVGGVRHGRVMLHTLADGRIFLTLPCIPGDHGYRVIPIAEIRRGLDDGVWREV